MPVQRTLLPQADAIQHGSGADRSVVDGVADRLIAIDGTGQLFSSGSIDGDGFGKSRTVTASGIPLSQRRKALYQALWPPYAKRHPG